MGTREFGKRMARRWTGGITAAGIALTGLVGVGTYHALETSTTSVSSGTTGATDDSATSSSSSGLASGSGTSQTRSSGS